jgi:hypothetical protein
MTIAASQGSSHPVPAQCRPKYRNTNLPPPKNQSAGLGQTGTCIPAGESWHAWVKNQFALKNPAVLQAIAEAVTSSRLSR